MAEEGLNHAKEFNFWLRVGSQTEKEGRVAPHRIRKRNTIKIPIYFTPLFSRVIRVIRVY